jgi:hypothetical protein
MKTLIRAGLLAVGVLALSGTCSYGWGGGHGGMHGAFRGGGRGGVAQHEGFHHGNLHRRDGRIHRQPALGRGFERRGLFTGQKPFFGQREFFWRSLYFNPRGLTYLYSSPYPYYSPYPTGGIYVEPEGSSVSPPVEYHGEGTGARMYEPGRDALAASGVAVGNEQRDSPAIARPRVARALDENELGESSSWVDARTGAENTVTPTRDLEGKGDCRAYSHVVVIPTGNLEASAVACRTPKGKWEIQ